MERNSVSFSDSAENFLKKSQSYYRFSESPENLDEGAHKNYRRKNNKISNNKSKFSVRKSRGATFIA